MLRLTKRLPDAMPTAARAIGARQFRTSAMRPHQAGLFGSQPRQPITPHDSGEEILARHPDELIHHLRAIGRSRCFFASTEDGRVQTSHETLEPLAAEISKSADWRSHEGVFLNIGPRSGTLMGAFICSTRRGQGSGGVRLWSYDRLDSFLTDGLRLSLAMGQKNALAGLWWGGAKGVVAAPPSVDVTNVKYRERLFHDYGDFLTSLRGCYVAAEDVGLNTADMDIIFSRTRHVTCISEERGGSGNPSAWTGKGVVCAIEAALEQQGMGTIEGKTFALQGVGNVGIAILEYLVERGAGKIVAHEVSKSAAERARKMFADNPNVSVGVVERDDQSILYEECDVLVPNALGAVLHPGTIQGIRAKIVCGAANNQLLDIHRDSALLQKNGVVFVPDFVANRMGIVNCANEAFGTTPDDPLILRHLGRDWEHSVFNVTTRLLNMANDAEITPIQAAEVMANEEGVRLNPIVGHRSHEIIKGLISGGWADEGGVDP